MKLNQYRPIFIVSLISLILFLLHTVVLFLFFPAQFEKEFIYSIPLLYLFFYLFSAIIVFILIEVNKKNINNVGFTFMLLTSIKMAIAYFFMQPILNSKSFYAGSEKINFFIIFILFLIIETTVTIRILNNKQ